MKATPTLILVEDISVKIIALLSGSGKGAVGAN